MTFPHHTVFFLLLVFVSLFFWMFVHFDGRSLQDHDLYFLDLGFVYLEAGDDHFIWSGTVDYLKQTSYPLVNLYCRVAYKILGLDAAHFRLFNLPFFLLLIGGVYCTGILFRDKTCGLLSAFVMATMPFFLNFSRVFFLHFHMTAVLVWGYALVLVLLKNKSSLPIHLLLGLVLCIASLMHPLAQLQAVPIYVFLAIYPLLMKKHLLRTIFYCLLSIVPLMLAFSFRHSFYLAYKSEKAENLLLQDNWLDLLRSGVEQFFDAFGLSYFLIVLFSFFLLFLFRKNNVKRGPVRFFFLACTLFYVFFHLYLTSTVKSFLKPHHA